MKRDYKSGVSDTPIFFTGIEVEKTPAFGLKTLFVTGLQEPAMIQKHYDKEKCEHIFFGANHSFNPGINFPEDGDEWVQWENLIKAFLESGLIEYNNFIPQLRVPVPYVKQWNYNTMLKIDDKDFKATNPGVWCHSLHDLLDREKFTDWSKYGLDKPLL